MIVTSTYYESTEDHRYKLALAMLAEAREWGIPTIVADSSPKHVWRSLTTHATVVIQSRHTKMGPKRREGFEIALASGYKRIAWLEPEKVDLVHSLPMLYSRVVAEAPIVIPCRKNLDSYPAYQQTIEAACNWKANLLLGTRGLDLWFGARVFNQSGAQYFLDYQGEYGDDGWEATYVPVYAALAAGRRVTPVLVHFHYPRAQREYEEGNTEMDYKRNRQAEILLDITRRACADLGLPRFR